MGRLTAASGLVLVALGACLSNGCDGGPRLYPVTGTIQFKGKPLNEGVIDFEPMDGQGSKSGASIVNGSYEIPKDKGLMPGRYKISIYAGDGVPRSGNAEPSGRLPQGITPGKERIPARYNTKSDVIKEVTKDGPNKIDFDIS